MVTKAVIVDIASGGKNTAITATRRFYDDDGNMIASRAITVLIAAKMVCRYDSGTPRWVAPHHSFGINHGDELMPTIAMLDKIGCAWRVADVTLVRVDRFGI